ncbi:hypothetical protein GGR52DRAFT_319561 [Hypoxylon sp. FL1284]|nr:hypothetical protein GGR52DRAFT_319561 [Hypoxylon sp. FL1284]
MPYLWGPLWATSLAVMFAATASASSIRPDMLLSRADETCAADGYARCAQTGLPDNFCCETGSTCLVLAGNTTVLCCPKGSACAKISAITCDITLQDASVNPAAEIKTTALDSELEKCGTQCCPFGYHCDGTICLKNDDQSEKPSPAPKPSGTSTAASSTRTSNPTSSTTVAVSGITSSAPSTSETPAPSTESTSNTARIVGGVVGGVIGLVIIIVAVVVLRFRRRKRERREVGQKHELQRHNSSTSSFGNIISAPVPHAEYPSQRIDFLAKRSQASGSTRGTATITTATPSMSSPITSSQAQRRPQRDAEDDDDDAYERGFGFMPPNSPYSAFARRPDSALLDAPRSYHQSAEISGLRSLTDWRPNHSKSSADDYLSPAPAPLTAASSSRDRDRERRQHSDGSESINIFADPITFGGRPTSAATTWSNIQKRADRDNGNGRRT